MTLATVNVLPLPVMPSSDLVRSRRSRPRTSSSMARGWSPRGLKSETSSKRFDMEPATLGPAPGRRNPGQDRTMSHPDILLPYFAALGILASMRRLSFAALCVAMASAAACSLVNAPADATRRLLHERRRRMSPQTTIARLWVTTATPPRASPASARSRRRPTTPRATTAPTAPPTMSA